MYPCLFLPPTTLKSVRQHVSLSLADTGGLLVGGRSPLRKKISPMFFSLSEKPSRKSRKKSLIHSPEWNSVSAPDPYDSGNLSFTAVYINNRDCKIVYWIKTTLVIFNFYFLLFKVRKISYLEALRFLWRITTPPHHISPLLIFIFMH